MPKKPVDIPWPLSSAPGTRPQESGGRLINCSVEPLGDAGPNKVKWIRQPGLTSFATQAITGYRGAILVGSTVYAAWANRAKRFDSVGAVTDIAGLTGTKKITWARNNKGGTPDIQAVDIDNGAFSVSAGAVAAFNGLGNLPQPNSVCFQDGYFFWTIADRRIFASGINDTVVNTQTFTTCEAKASDTLYRSIAYRGLLFAMLSSSIEVFSDTAEAFPKFPYTRLAVIQRGLIGPFAVAGWEDGFGQLYWVADDNGVYRLKGLEPEKVSPPDLDKLIEAVTDKTTLEAYCYTFAGKSFWVISSDDWSWEFNLGTEKWNERDSYNAGSYERWRATGSSVNAFGKWLVGDGQSGNVVYIDDSNYGEVTSLQRFRMESGPVALFPNRTRIGRADFDFVTGVGIATGTDPVQTDPTVAIASSKNGGINWGNPWQRKLGRQAKSLQRVYVVNAGQSGPQGERWRLDVTDNVYVSFMGGTQATGLRAF